MRARLLAALLLCAIPAAAHAFQEPPIQDARDAACRADARAKVFTAPDPDGVGLFETGKRLYLACMQATSAAKSRSLAVARP